MPGDIRDTMRSAIVVVLALVSPCLGSAQSHPLTEVVETYLARYAAEDADGLGELVGPGVIFEDPTTELVGREAFVIGLRQAFSGFTIHGLEEEQRIYSGSAHVLLIGRVHFTMSGAARALVVPFAMSLKVVDGLVVRHVDFVDSFEFARQMRGLANERSLGLRQSDRAQSR